MAGALNAAQLSQMDKTQSLLPTVNPITTIILGSFIAKNQPLLAELNRRPELQAALMSDQGVAVRSLSPTVQDWAKPLLGGQIPVTTRLRIKQNDYNDTLPPTAADPTPIKMTGRRIQSILFLKETPDARRELITASLYSWYGRPRDF
ncbi:MAG: hypothetical protein H7Z41_00585 [Cytophagales bacterium]|nr:hypothetical protein [Armatimonadota bacterium]